MDFYNVLIAASVLCAVGAVISAFLARRQYHRAPTYPRRMCILGYGHTSHIWELTGNYPLETGVYFCAGQPFSDGTDPATDPIPRNLAERINQLHQENT